MSKRSLIALCFSAVMLLAILGGSASADSGTPNLVGSWEVLSVLDGSTDAVPSLFTYSVDGTLIATGPTAANSSSHGAWAQTGSRTYTSNEISFIYGPTGTVVGTLSINATLTVAADGQTYDVEFDGEFRFGDGTVNPISGTAVGKRINAGDGDGDSDSDSDSD